MEATVATADTSTLQTSLAESSTARERAHGPRTNRQNRNRPPRTTSSTTAADGPASTTQRDPAVGSRRKWRPKDDTGAPASRSLQVSGSNSQHRPRRPSPQQNLSNNLSRELLNAGDAASTTAGNVETLGPGQTSAAAANITPPVNRSTPGQRNNRRGRNFVGSLTEPSEASSHATHSAKKGDRRRPTAPIKDDLTSILIHAISTPPYPDCLICFSAIHPAQPTWSCSPSALSGTVETAQCCWTTFHLRCIRSWAAKSVTEVVEAWRARGEDRKGEWRCPGCRTERETVPTEYRCFCGSILEPRPTGLATPHSCANLCSRPRACRHACPLPCHPGPCPPCQIVTSKACYCAKRVMTFKCSHLVRPKEASALATSAPDLSCGAICGKKLGCGNHLCGKVCHVGECEPCDVREVVKCYCGKDERDVPCGEGEAQECAVATEAWIGKFNCGNPCTRPFDCGLHFCSKLCHPPSFSPPPCPRSPTEMTHCPCGKHVLSSLEISFFPPDTVLPRKTCSDPIPSCHSTCLKPLLDCEHVCSNRCHVGPCPPCSIMLVRPCRCGAMTKDIKCSTVKKAGHEEHLCDRPCTALRACGRHQCGRVCCPLASLASAAKGKGKKRGAVAEQVGMDEMGLHECDLICGKMLGCGNHRCEERDHRGACPPCLRSGFEEVICHCGRTVLEPPIPCGTRINCVHQCMRDLPPCGHPRAPHSCHEDASACPPCPFLTGKACACGKKVVDNVRCSQEKVSCGVVCGKLLECGFHHCEKLCHGDGCGPCTSSCGKYRKLCLPEHHPCPLPCHAPSSCPEVEPCRAVVTLMCPCNRIRQTAPCGRSASNSLGCESTLQPKCNNECAIAKRNARLAEAFGINPETRSKVGAVVFNDDLVSFARINPKLLGLVEKTFGDFVPSDKKTQVLPQMPADRRKFVISMASIYRMDTQMVDQEPHRSVQLIRRIDTRMPSPLLSEVLASSTVAPNSLGKLADLRAVNTPIKSIGRSPAPTPRIASPRGWTSVVARTGNNTAGAGGSVEGRLTASVTIGGTGVVAPPALAPDTPVVVPDDWEETS